MKMASFASFGHRAGAPRRQHLGTHSLLRTFKARRDCIGNLSVKSAAGVIRESKSSIDFPKTVDFWHTDQKGRLVGVGCREKKILFYAAKVYALGVYLEAKSAINEFGVRARGGFFDDASSFQYCDAVLDATCNKLLVIVLLRDLSGSDFVGAIQEKLEPRLAFTGEAEVLQRFAAHFAGTSLKQGSQVLLSWSPDSSTLEVSMLQQGDIDYAQVTPNASFQSAGLCRALFEIWLGSDGVIPELHQSCANGVQELIVYDKEERGEWKPGGRWTDV